MRSEPQTVHRKIVERADAFRAVGNFSYGTQDPYLKYYFGESARQKRKQERKSNPRIVRVFEEESYEGRNYSTHRSTRKRKRFI